jgi:hypothetical protein
VEGPSKENMMKVMDLVDSISSKEKASLSQNYNDTTVIDTNFNKVFGLVQNKFRLGSFTSKDILEAYEEHFKLPTTLSTISTYLSRLASRGLLMRSRNGSGWVYRLPRISQSTQLNEARVKNTHPIESEPTLLPSTT